MSIFRSRPLRALGYLSMAVFPLFCLLVLDYMNYRNLDRLLQHCELQPGPVRFEIVVILLGFAPPERTDGRGDGRPVLSVRLYQLHKSSRQWG